MTSTVIRHDDPQVSSRGSGTGLLSVPAAYLWETLNGKYFLLLAMAMVYQLSYQHTRWLEQGDALAIPIEVIPVPETAWYTVCWLTLMGLILALVGVRRPLRYPDSDLTIRRATIAAIAMLYFSEIAVRVFSIGFWGLMNLFGPAIVLVPTGMMLVATVLLIRRPPSTKTLFIMMVTGGILLRVFMVAATQMNDQYADNLPAVAASLKLLLAGQTPYVLHNFDTHMSDMHYFPWTLLSYLPPFLVGWDIRLTNIVLTLAMAGIMWIVISSLKLAVMARNALLLALGVFLMLPKPIGHDAYNEFQMFNLTIVLTFALIIFRHTFLAAAAYGAALGAMPLAIYFSLPLLAFAVRMFNSKQLFQALTLAFLVAAVPLFVFLAWDPQQFIATVLVMPGSAFRAVLPVPYRAIWHFVFEGRYLFVIATISAVVGWCAFTRLHTIYGLIGLSAMGYLSLIMFGPYVVSHVTTVALCLVLMAEAVYLSSRSIPEQYQQTVPRTTNFSQNGTLKAS